MKTANIIKIESYSETLKQHPKNKILAYKLTNPLSYSGFHNAKTRLTKIGYEFSFKVVHYKDNDYLQVERIK